MSVLKAGECVSKTIAHVSKTVVQARGRAYVAVTEDDGEKYRVLDEETLRPVGTLTRDGQGWKGLSASRGPAGMDDCDILDDVGPQLFLAAPTQATSTQAPGA